MRPHSRAAHAGQDRLSAQECRFLVDGNPKVEILLANSGDCDPGVVHQHVDRAAFACDARRHIADLRAGGDVSADRDRLSAGGANLRDDRLSILGARLEIDRNRGALLGERQRDRPADATRSAGDQGDTPLKINHVRPSHA